LCFVVLVVIAACGGGSSPTSPTSSGGGSTTTTSTTGGGSSTQGSCRNGPGTYRITTAAGAGVTSTTNGTCVFNPTSVEGTCTNQYSDNFGQNFTSVSVTRHASRGDVVDEVSVIPPLNRSISTTTTITGTVNSVGTSVHTYDAQRRLVQTASTTQQQSGQTTTSTTTYTAWDSAGRPTAGSTSTGTQLSFTYDNASRTQVSTTVGSGVSCSQVFDQNGNPTTGTCTNGATTTMTMMTTVQVCR
jgi:YD repeat-containing protein